MMNKKIRVSKDSSLSSISRFPGGDVAMARFKHRCLMRDYEELLKKTKEKRDRLKKLLQKKVQLLAEVKFLQRKFQQFSTTQKVQFKLKKHIHKYSSPSGCIVHPKNPVFQTELPLKSRSQKKQFFASTSTALIDLNQAFLPTTEEMEVFDANQKSQNADWFESFSRNGGDELTNDSMLSICRAGIGSNKAAKRKVSWQDQLVLRV